MFGIPDEILALVFDILLLTSYFSCDQRLIFSLCTLRLVDAVSPRTNSIDKKYLYPLKPRVYGPPNGLDISIDGVYIPLFVTFYDIFAESILVLLSLLQL